MFRGEEKCDLKHLGDARSELSSKFGTWSPLFYGQFPYVFTYAIGGFFIK